MPESVEIPVGQTEVEFPITTEKSTPNSLQVVISATTADTTLQETLTVQVVTVTVTPPEITIFEGGSQQFLALVIGDETDAGLTWSVMSPGASVSSTGVFSALTPGDYTL